MRLTEFISRNMERILEHWEAFAATRVSAASHMGSLEHDLRSPLQTIQMTARYLQVLNGRPDVSKAASRLINSGARMQALLNDLLDFNRVTLGLGIRVTPTPTDLASLCAEELEGIRAAHPDHSVELEVPAVATVYGTADVSGNCSTTW
jgi:signal transduction histidine kinase